MPRPEKLEWMLVRDASFAEHWSEPPATFGPMPKAEADRMAASQYGGRVVHVSDFARRGYL